MTSPQEKEVLAHLSRAWEEFLALPNKHPDDLDEFRHPLHQLQMIIAWRVARRADPDTWGTEGK